MLKFYFNGSPNPTKVALFLEEAELPYEPVAVDTRRGQQFDPAYLAVNPHGKVPAIDDDGVHVWESLAVLEYLAEKFPQAELWPADTQARAHARAIGFPRSPGRSTRTRANGGPSPRPTASSRR